MDDLDAQSASGRLALHRGQLLRIAKRTQNVEIFWRIGLLMGIVAIVLELAPTSIGS